MNPAHVALLHRAIMAHLAARGMLHPGLGGMAPPQMGIPQTPPGLGGLGGMAGPGAPGMGLGIHPAVATLGAHPHAAHSMR